MTPLTLNFLNYFGSKVKIGLRYPPPQYDVIIEPFAGGAGYASNYPERQIILTDRDENVAALWTYLITSPAEDIAKLPVVPAAELGDIRTNAQTKDLCLGAKLLLASWYSTSSRFPLWTTTDWGGTTWTEKRRDRIAENLKYIRHWTFVHQGWDRSVDFEREDGKQTWFVDPPYNNRAGRDYRHHNIDYIWLGMWCKKRTGQIIVCENLGARWLPFQQQMAINGIKGRETAVEVYWTNTP